MTGQDATALDVEPFSETTEPKAPSWMPKIGEELIGTFRGWSVGTDRNSKNHFVALIEDDEEQLYSVWCYHVVLKKAINRASPQKGDRIKIERLGDCTSTKGRPYRMYRVEVLNRVALEKSNGSTGSDLKPEGGPS